MRPKPTKQQTVNNKTVYIISGPTASGKSAYALEKARRDNGVIINCDSMQIYDALPILTARPSAEEQAQAPHKLYAFLHPAKHYSAAMWRDDAMAAIRDAFDNGQTPILCGGTGFYLRALIHGFSPVPDIPDTVREQAIALQKQVGNPQFHAMLAEKDPETAAKLDPMNSQRLIRAWEVLAHTGKGLAAWQSTPAEKPDHDWTFHVTAILPDRAKLYDKINKRLDDMVTAGCLNEVRDLADMIEKGEVPDNALVVKAHGFRPFRRYLNGEWTMEQALDHTKTEIRQYAKRQMTWLRHQIDVDEIITPL